MKPRVLIVEDDVDGARSVAQAVADIDCEPQVAMTGAEGIAAFAAHRPDIVLSDLRLPDISGVDVLTQVRHRDSTVPVMIMTAYGSVSTAVEAMQAGAYDYITKPLDLDELQAKVRRALETARLRRQVVELQSSIADRHAARNIVAVSAAMRRVMEEVESVAGTDATVLVLGESGTGKEVVARAIHVEGRRRAGPFVAVNCGAFTETLLDSELFGHEKGAFTGATQQHQGAFERADGGTLLLDEIGDAPPAVQVKLLRVLEERELVRVGGQGPVKVDVRVISASNRDLDALAQQGDFRQDLLYRLNVVAITLPPLREHREDIRPLAERFIAQAAAEHGRHIREVDPGYYAALEAYDWPGNVRQLRNAVEVSVVMAREARLTAANLRLPRESAADTATGFTVPAGMSFEAIEREILVQTLNRCEGNRTLAADRLGISRRTIQRKIKELDLPF